jgi:hypothetical protein
MIISFVAHWKPLIGALDVTESLKRLSNTILTLFAFRCGIFYISTLYFHKMFC